MSFIRKIFPAKRCKVCYRDRLTAITEQTERLLTCSTTNCPFQEQIEDAIHDAQKAELLSFNLSKSEALEGSYITVSWETKNCKVVSITNYGDVELPYQKRIQLKRETKEIEIIIEDLFGETFAAKKPVKVLPKPTLEIVELADKILKGESFFIRYTATNFNSIYLKDESGNIISDLTKSNVYSSPTLTTDRNLLIYVEGKYGGQIQKQIEIKTFEPPVINIFKCDNSEKVDTLPIFFEFDFANVSKAELLMNDSSIADITSLKSFTHISENKTANVLTFKYELAVTGLTGKVIKTELPNRISVYPQPSISELRVSPDSIILFPKEISISNRSTFCEKIIFQDGKGERTIEPNSSININPTENTTYSFRPIGKQNFHGEPKTLFVEVFYPIELHATQSKKITLPNVPVKISWEANNQTQVLIQPGNVDVTHKTSYDITLESKTTVKVIAINKRDRKEFSLFIDVLQYQRINKETLRSLPKLDFYVPKLESIVPDIKKDMKMETQTVKGTLPVNLSTKILEPLKRIIPRTDFGFQRMWRDKMFQELKSQKRNQKSV